MYINPYKRLPDTEVNKQLKKLMENLPFTTVTVFDSYMVYTMPFAYSGAHQVKEKIKELGLNLEVVHANKSITKSSFTVKGKDA